MILPWHKQHWEELCHVFDSLHHGQLIEAPEGTGLLEFCVSVSRLLLCNEPEQEAGKWCGKCQSCKLFTAGSHPDFHLLTTEKDAIEGGSVIISEYSNRYQDITEREKRAKPAKVIAVEQVRRLIDNFSTHTHIALRRVVLLYPADRLNRNAANALLKLLEEPPDNSVFLVATSEPFRLPKTVISRCVHLRLPCPDHAEAEVWLEKHMSPSDSKTAFALAGGAPLKAKSIFESGLVKSRLEMLQGVQNVFPSTLPALECAKSLSSLEFEDTLRWLQGFITEIIKWKETNQPPWWNVENVVNPNQLSTVKLFKIYDKITDYRRISRGNINELLALEDILLSLSRISL